MKVGAQPGAGAAGPGTIEALEERVAALCARRAIRVPPYPAVALRVQEAMVRKDFGLAQVAQLVGADAALAADILRCANSALYRRDAPFTDLTAAITRIGAQQVLRLLLVSGLAATAHAAGPLATLRRRFWIEGLTSATVCRELAELRRLHAEEAFAVGLLHDFGKIVAASALEAVVQEHGFEGRFPFEAWASVAERQHVAVGALAAERWRLPPIVGEVIAAHHEPRGSCSDPALLEVVRASDAVVALALERPCVTAADLAAAEGVRPGERAAVEAVVEKVPEFVAAFEAGTAMPASPSPRVAPAGPACADGRKVRFGVSLTVARRAHMLMAIWAGPGGLVLRGEEPLPENRLLEAKVYSADPFKMWVLCRACRREEEGFLVEAQPFALSGPARESWEAILAEPRQPSG
jgi:putative nucleotidyltransferase with HDIG domain